MQTMQRPRSIALDFDGTVFAGEFTRADEVVGPAHPGAIDWIREQLDAGVMIIMHTCRLTPEYPGSYWKDHKDVRDVQAALSKWLGQWLAEDELSMLRWWKHIGKPPADLYLDDKGLRFEGKFPKFI